MPHAVSASFVSRRANSETSTSPSTVRSPDGERDSMVQVCVHLFGADSWPCLPARKPRVCITVLCCHSLDRGCAPLLWNQGNGYHMLAELTASLKIVLPIETDGSARTAVFDFCRHLALWWVSRFAQRNVSVQVQVVTDWRAELEFRIN